MTSSPSTELAQDRAAAEHAHATHLAGLRAVALLELLKGTLALAGGAALLTQLHKDLGDVVENILEALHLNPDHRIFQHMIDAAGRIDERRIVELFFVAIGYAIIRSIEAYGLWNARAWAEWFAIVSGSAYFPWEILEVIKHPHHPLRWAVLGVNILVVLYMIYVRWDTLKAGKLSAA
ncbi:MAG: DUF2127 domain-containing protein [Acidobacteria bacterium]|nr:DUF2127 domain-containing protein [Acidobacteriota bacterium]MBV9145892.1 DUF2127 domain-containing protein [Acidobacteriota bacterium]MBV9434508.1 DUF2127 domain-containing protein [Acidobacteriota bacterium]